MVNVIHKELSYQLNGVLFSVHNSVGKYASEAQVCDLIEQELKVAGIQYEREK